MHEQRGGDAYGAVPFDFFFSVGADGMPVTPERVQGNGAGRPSMYSELAIPLYDGDEHQAASLALMLSAKGICGDGNSGGGGGTSSVAPAKTRWLKSLKMLGVRSKVGSEKASDAVTAISINASYAEGGGGGLGLSTVSHKTREEEEAPSSLSSHRL